MKKLYHLEGIDIETTDIHDSKYSSLRLRVSSALYSGDKSVLQCIKLLFKSDHLDYDLNRVSGFLTFVAKSGYKLSAPELKKVLKCVKLQVLDLEGAAGGDVPVRLGIAYRTLSKMLRDIK